MEGDASVEEYGHVRYCILYIIFDVDCIAMVALVMNDDTVLLGRRLDEAQSSSHVEVAPQIYRFQTAILRHDLDASSWTAARHPADMAWPALPARAGYLALKNAKRRNALSLEVLRDLRDQLYAYNKSPLDGQLRLLPPFKPDILAELETAADDAHSEAGRRYDWLLDSHKWREHRKGLPNVVVLRSEGPVFSSGHDLGELRTLSHGEVKETFALCAEVMSMIRRSPAPVIGVIQGLATAAGAQLALTTDLPLTCASTQFRLPGASIGLPCTSPSTAASRRLGHAFTYRMLALAEPVRADKLPGGAVQVVADEEALEKRLAEMVSQLSEKSAGQPQALGKWGYWTQLSLNGGESGGDGYEDAVEWAGRIMALHARSDDAREGMTAFFEKRSPVWQT